MINIILLWYVLPLVFMLFYAIFIDKGVKNVRELFNNGAFIFAPMINLMAVFIVVIGSLIEWLGKTKLSILWDKFLNIRFKKL